MAAKGRKNDSGNWQDRVHQIEFDEPEKITLKTLVDADNRPTIERLKALVVDNNSVKVKSAEYFDSYTISYTLDKTHPKYPGHTFWFWHHSIEEGISILAAFVETMLQDHLEQGAPPTQKSVW